MSLSLSRTLSVLLCLTYTSFLLLRYSYAKCFCQMASTDKLIHDGPCLTALPIKWAVTLAWAAEIWTQESNWNDAVNGIYGLCAFYYYATSILSLPFSLSLRLSAIFQHFPLLAISSRAKKETINGRWGWPTDAKHRLYYPLSVSLPLSLPSPLHCHDSFWPIGNFVISHALCASLMFITHKWTHIDWYFTSSGGLLLL